MAQHSGVIQAIETREVSGGRKAYSLRIGGEAFGAGLYAPKAKEGDYVTFEVEMNGNYKNVGRNSLRVSEYKPAPAETTPTPATTKTAGTGNKDQYWENKEKVDIERQDTISRQAASNSALAFMSVLASQDALGLPKSEAKGVRIKALTALLNKLEAEFYERNTGKAYVSIAPVVKDAKGEDAGDEQAEEQGAFPDQSWD